MNQPLPGTTGAIDTSTVGPLSDGEQSVLGMILCDPRASDRGAWLHPLHQDITRLGFTAPETTSMLHRLESLGIIELHDVPTRHSATGKPTLAPVCRVTELGFKVANTYQRVMKFKATYHYIVDVGGDESLNQTFLEAIKSIFGVQSGSRFIARQSQGTARIAIWANRSLIDDLPSIAARTSATIVRIVED